MDLTVHIPDEAVPALRAKASGVPLEVFAEKVLLRQIQDDGIPLSNEGTLDRRTGQELIDACAGLQGLLTDEEVDTDFRRNPLLRAGSILNEWIPFGYQRSF
jgi:hypothetical protein